MRYHTATAVEKKIFFFGGIVIDDLKKDNMKLGLKAKLASNDMTILDTGTQFFAIGIVFWLPLVHKFLHATETMKWSKEVIQGYPPPPRKFHTSTLVGNQLYIFGGVDENNTLCSNDMYILDIGKCPSLKQNSMCNHKKSNEDNCCSQHDVHHRVG